MWNPFKKKIVFDPNPKIKIEGNCFVTVVVLTSNIGCNTVTHLSEIPYKDYQILEQLIEVKRFIKVFPEATIDVRQYECTLKSVTSRKLR